MQITKTESYSLHLVLSLLHTVDVKFKAPVNSLFVTFLTNQQNYRINLLVDVTIAKMKGVKIPPMLKQNLLTILTVGGVIAGVVLGLVVRAASDEKWTEREVSYIYFLGDIFLRMLKCLILPLIISTLISAVGSLDLKLSGKIGSRAVAYYLLTTVLAVILGIIIVMVVQPGSRVSGSDVEAEGHNGRNITITDTLLDLVR